MRYSWAAWRLFSFSIGVFSVVSVLVFMVYMLHGVIVVVQLLRGLGVSFSRLCVRLFVFLFCLCMVLDKKIKENHSQ